MCIIIKTRKNGERKMHAIEKQKSPVQSLAETVLDPHTANFWLQKFNPLWSVSQPLGKIVEIQQTAADTVSLKIQVNRHFKMGLAGQHHPVIVEIAGRRYERTYSLTQIDQHHVLLTVKAVDQGVVSQWLCNEAKFGDVLEFGLPYGDMTAVDQNQVLVLLAAGSGITPMYSLIKQLEATDKIATQSVTLLYWVKQQADAAFAEYFETLAEQFEHFKVHIFHTQQTPTDARLNAEHLYLIQDVTNSTVYACGPSGFVHTAENVFTTAKQFKSEAFSLTPIISDETGFVNVTLTKSNKVLSIPKGQSILVGLEQQNIKPQHGCRMGICNKCACNKAQGATKNLVNGQDNAEPNNLLRICVNTAQTDLVIDI